VNHEQGEKESVERVISDENLNQKGLARKKAKSTVAARSSSRQKELNGFKDPLEQYAVNT